MCVHVHTCVVYAVVCACGGERSMLNVFLYSSSYCFSVTGSFTNPELTNLEKLVSKQVPDIFLSLPPQYWNCRHPLSYPTF